MDILSYLLAFFNTLIIPQVNLIFFGLNNTILFFSISKIVFYNFLKLIIIYTNINHFDKVYGISTNSIFNNKFFKI